MVDKPYRKKGKKQTESETYGGERAIKPMKGKGRKKGEKENRV